MTLHIDVSPATARRITDDPENLRRVAAMIEAAFGALDEQDDETLLSPDDEVALDEAYLAVSEGRVHRFDPTLAHTKATELLRTS